MPADLGELIPKEHMVRTINEAIEQIDLTILYAQYKGGGTSSYHHIKYNRNFRRFMLCGLQKVRTELGLLSLAHNFIKLAAS